MADLTTEIRAYRRFLDDLPSIVADTIIDWVLDNFESESYEGVPWPERKEPDSSRALLVGERGGAGRRSIRVTSRSKKQVTIGTDLDYMIAHNEGARISMDITPKMRRFFWAMHFQYEVNQDGTLKVPEDKVKWKWMALKKGRITFNMPQRQFLGPSKELDLKISEAIEQRLKTIFT
ncbi:hypothetical protein [Cyclobacterium marinum]|mgnify:CR=1 FL=1|uniref:hypothetical protein n=1 Tax=Cyclobacterium marinum TaxID=104 RepID=UPI0030DAE635|tara:strand:+ start:40096 stop:40626 length:531 start_codon:yes stop_codon:yes gene_type:complete